MMKTQAINEIEPAIEVIYHNHLYELLSFWSQELPHVPISTQICPFRVQEK